LDLFEQRIRGLVDFRGDFIAGPFEDRDGPGNLTVIARVQRTEFGPRPRDPAKAREHIVDHPVEAHPPAVLRGVDLLDAMPLESLDLVWSDGSATTDHHANVFVTALTEHVHHVGEVLVVSALIRADRDRIRVLLDRGPDDVRHAAVVAQVHHFGTMHLQQAADHVDRGVVPVEE
jgi:hypothetical protein